MFNRELRSPFHLLQPRTQDNQACAVESKKNTRSFKKGALVWARNFAGGDKWIPGIVQQKLGNVTYEIKFKDKEPSNRHINHLKERFENKQKESEVRQSEEDQDHLLLAQSDVGESEVRGDLPIPALAPNEPSTSSLRRSSRATRPPAWARDYVGQ